jgi:hypothetical protein
MNNPEKLATKSTIWLNNVRDFAFCLWLCLANMMHVEELHIYVSVWISIGWRWRRGVFVYAMNIQNDVIGLVLRENCKSKQMTDIIAWPSRCHGRILATIQFNSKYFIDKYFKWTPNICIFPVCWHNRHHSSWPFLECRSSKLYFKILWKYDDWSFRFYHFLENGRFYRENTCKY